MTVPPFPALRAFHVAASHDRFRDAAEALGVTESSISHQVRRLEDFLHLALFERQGNGLTLTPEGQHYFEEVDPALRRIEEATSALIGTARRKRVALTLPPSLAILCSGSFQTWPAWKKPARASICNWSLQPHSAI